ncbi:lipoprotein UxpA [Pseudomonas sp. R5(2019)]|uniref:lipoprotein UxpA n=1 Tax=Pseudomonas sp. R5(2019) TaxID=2697566 RepID=UPI001411FDD1|nr:lipoprotein UxpA [Pseudomonas sp. R5(2019)]NBA98009.1 lipoprotein UxpA [Pseudomonas sp. R5(2019)]
MKRREVLGLMAVAAVAPWMSACSTLKAPGSASGSAVELLYVADTLDARQPGLPVVPRTRLGPVTRVGQAPWLTGASARQQFPLDPSTAPLLDAALTGNQATDGYAVLGAMLQRWREQAGADNSLTLENGQCWNGSGLAYLTRGVSGLQGSALLGSEVRVSSDERHLWPQQCAGLYHQYQQPVLGAGLSAEQARQLGTEDFAVFRRGGVRIAVVGITDPYARDQAATLSQWHQRLQPVFKQAREQADLVIGLADVGTGPGFWLAERLSEVDLLLCARGQDLWPAPIEVTQASGKRVPLVLAGTRASGAFRIRCQTTQAGWQFTAQFQPAMLHSLDEAGQRHARQLQQTLTQQRAAHAGWLDQPLGRAPEPLWRRDVRAGSWDRLIHQALAGHEQHAVLLPGLRYDSPLAAGANITREHLINLTGSHPAAVLEAPAEQVGRVLENAAEQLFGEPLLLDNSQDLPRWLGQPWEVAYSPGGRRISGLEVSAGQCRTFALGADAQAGEPLWQRLETFIREQPAGWQLPQLPLPHLHYVQGHPGWHPQGMLS